MCLLFRFLILLLTFSSIVCLKFLLVCLLHFSCFLSICSLFEVPPCLIFWIFFISYLAVKFLFQSLMGVVELPALPPSPPPPTPSPTSCFTLCNPRSPLPHPLPKGKKKLIQDAHNYGLLISESYRRHGCTCHVQCRCLFVCWVLNILATC